MVRTTLVILTRNEISGVKEVLKNIPLKLVDEVFAVDYKSTDGTVEFLKKHKIPVIKQTVAGRGNAFKIAVKKARGEFIIFFSPDGNENPKDIAKLLPKIKDHDLVIASRFMKGSRNEEDDKVLKFRKWANEAFSIAVRVFWGGKVTDTINGYRIINKEFFKKLHLDEEGFAIEFQMTIRTLKLGGKIYEIPTKEGDRIGGMSTANSIPTGIKFVKLLIKELRIGSNF